MGGELLERLRALPGLRPALDALAGEPGVHVVGGAVRDLLLGHDPRELDVVVEGDAHAVARRVARRLGGEAVLHERFGTATVRDGASFDLAGARRERYARPGALPDVELGATLAQDLERRDFTVNAIALRLADGALTAYPGAQADLGARVLRVLHGRSFEDDPTRMLRMARYAARLGFEVEPATAALARPELLRTVTGPRLGAELALLLREPQPDALLELDRRGLGKAMFGAMAVDPDRLMRVIETAPADARLDLALLAGCLPGAEGVGARLRELGFRAAEATIVQDAARAQAGPELPRSAVARRLRAQPVEAVTLLAADGSEAARWWLQDGRHRRLAISGEDLAGLEGPAVGAALERAWAAMLDGDAPTREDQLRAALGS